MIVVSCFVHIIYNSSFASTYRGCNFALTLFLHLLLPFVRSIHSLSWHTKSFSQFCSCYFYLHLRFHIHRCIIILLLIGRIACLWCLVINVRADTKKKNKSLKEHYRFCCCLFRESSCLVRFCFYFINIHFLLLSKIISHSLGILSHSHFVIKHILKKKKKCEFSCSLFFFFLLLLNVCCIKNSV